MAFEQVAAAGGDLHIETYGDRAKPAIVLLHGFTGSTATWHTMASRLQDIFHVVLIDLRGHGRSACPADSTAYSMEQQTADLEQVFAELGLSRFALVGYSMGGRVALGYAAAYPQRIGALILESASPGLRTAEERTERMERDAALAARLRNEPYAEFVDYWEAIPLFETQRTLPADRKAAIRSERLQQNPEALANSLDGIGTGRQPSYWGVLPDLKMPVLLITGTLDGKFTRLAAEMAGRLPNVSRAQVGNAGHAIHVEKPQEFVTIIESFTAHHLL